MVMGPIEVTLNVTVSPCFTVTVSGSKLGCAMAAIHTTRGDETVPA
jgi:hypothetical protein